MKKNKPIVSKKEINLYRFLFIGALFFLVVITLLYKTDKGDAKEQEIYFIGELNSFNEAANLLDQLNGKNKIISPYNLNSGLQLINEGTDHHTKEEINNYLKENSTKNYAYDLDMKNKYNFVKSYEELYIEYMEKLFQEKYHEISIQTLRSLKKQDKENIIILLNQIDMSYKSMVGEQSFPIKSIQNYKTTKEDEEKNVNFIKSMINKSLDLYETYSIKKEIKNRNYLYFNKNQFTKKELSSFFKQVEQKTKQTIDFFSVEEGSKIEEAIRKDTDEKIKYITETIDLELSHFISLNTFYFQANWNSSFEKKKVQFIEFENEEKQKQIVEMMYDYVDGYFENAYAKAFMKDFEGQDYSFVGILPKRIIAQASSLNLDELLSNKKEEKTLIGIPKFSITREIDCRSVLEKYGVKELFTEEADFSKITNKNLKLDAMIQKVSLTIAEKGTVGSEIESSDIETTYREKNTPEIILNKPFYFLILQKETNDVLFIGEISTFKND